MIKILFVPLFFEEPLPQLLPTSFWLLKVKLNVLYKEVVCKY